ncbi:hypothetical protein Ari01nite_98540 [Paractinoplanes rishiriensis]|uniref:Uncharacterized protein n=2 Tax=Paractinoplanes rishiriensis TaxID=1050105 RepID=A0A919K9R3_9ACTN|nr:hypothetical protein Ari01nite_98540 [Actinoplanes rishiriensis]
MDSYTITITPDDDSGNSTTLTVDISTGQARITSVHMHAPAGLTGAQMPSVDVELLLQAVTGPAPAAITAESTPPTAPQPAPTNTDADEPATTTAATPQSATGGTTPQASAPTPARRTGRRPTADAGTAESAQATTSGARRGRSKATPKKAAPGKTVRKQAPAAADAGGSAERAYRRMPDDFAAVYRQAGTTAAIADHYGVPRHTAQGWIGRHKKQHAAAN